jgi:WD40 repeat protein
MIPSRNPDPGLVTESSGTEEKNATGGLGGRRPREATCPHGVARLPALVRWLGVVAAVTLVSESTGGFASAAGPPSDWWINQSTAAMVVEPPPLAGIRRWSIDSPRHRGRISHAAFSPDGRHLATGGVDGVVRIWDVDNARFERALTGYRWNILELAWSPDGAALAVNSPIEGLIRVWEIETGRLLAELKRGGAHRLLCWSHDSLRLAASGGSSGSIFVSDGLGEFREVTATGQPISAFSWSSSNRFLVASQTNPIAIHDGTTGRQTLVLEDSENHNGPAVWSRDGSRIAADAGGSVAIWDTGTGKKLRLVPLRAIHLAWSFDGRTLAVQTTAGLHFVDPETGVESSRFVIPRAIWMGWQPEHERVATLDGQRVDFWTPGQSTAAPSISAGGVESPLFRPGAPLVTGLGTDTLMLWDAMTFAHRHDLRPDPPSGKRTFVKAALAPTGPGLATVDDRSTLQLWTTDDGMQVAAPANAVGPNRCVSWSADGTRLAVAGGDKVIRIVSREGTAASQLEGHAGHVRAMAWAPSGRQLVSAATDKSLLVWDVETGRQTASFPVDVEVSALGWTMVRGAPAIACGLVANGVSVINPSTGEDITTLAQGTRHPFATVAWLPGTTPRLLAGQVYHLVELFDAATGRATAWQLAPGGAVEALSANKGTLAATRAQDRTVRFWNAATGRLRGCLLDEAGVPVLVTATGDLRHPADAVPDLIAIVDAPEGQTTLRLDALARQHRWKNASGSKVFALPRTE